MKKLQFQIPQGYELDKENSTEETLIYKKKENKYPMSVNEINSERRYSIQGNSVNNYCNYDCRDSSITSNFTLGDKSPLLFSHIGYKSNLSTKQRAEAFLALMQLVELRDAWNKTDGFEVDWRDVHQKKYIKDKKGNIESVKSNELCSFSGQEIDFFDSSSPNTFCISTSRTLHFGSRETRDLFLKTFRDLIETAKELI